MQKPSVLPLLIAWIGIGLIAFSAVANPTPVLVWNVSASVPVGLYRVISGAPKHGDFVLVRPSKFIERLAAQRKYLPIGVPLIKHIAAVAGDNVCTLKSVVTINGRAVVHQLKADRLGRSLPSWNGCRMLEQNEYFLLGNAPDSLDSRYFGPVRSTSVIGRLVPLWTD